MLMQFTGLLLVQTGPSPTLQVQGKFQSRHKTDMGAARITHSLNNQGRGRKQESYHAQCYEIKSLFSNKITFSYTSRRSQKGLPLIRTIYYGVYLSVDRLYCNAQNHQNTQDMYVIMHFQQTEIRSSLFSDQSIWGFQEIPYFRFC